jgi:predicted ATP-grasp superfamily ATP-dependent carboligase
MLPGEGDFREELIRLAPECDYALVIAPDKLLAKFIGAIEMKVHHIGCGSINIAICANKIKTAEILRKNGINVPSIGTGEKRIIKPISGSGSIDTRISNEEPGKDEFSQEYIEGENLSVSMVIGRVTGNTCEFYSGKPPLVLAVNRQYVEVDAEGRISYTGGETPVVHPRQDEIIDTAIKAATVIGCQGYVGIDLIVSDKIYVIDVNPRITTSLVGIAACMQEEIADILVSASRGDVPESVTLTGHAVFDTHGMVSLK